MPWPRILEEEDALRGLTYYGSGRGLHRLADKLLAGQPIKIVAMGGSVTAWAGGNPNGEVRGQLMLCMACRLQADGACASFASAWL